MSAEVKSEVELEIAHILFIDTVGYSKLTINEQRELQELLNRVVRNTGCFRSAETAGKLLRLPTGDGMALVFADNIEAPLRCAMEISETLGAHPQLPIRMGIHSGPVSRVVDVNDRVNIAGAGVNIAQRVMSCGDAGHILLSRRVADDLAPYRHWQPYLHDLGEYEFKHGLKLHVVNLYKENLGNPNIPERLRHGRKSKGDFLIVKPAGFFSRWPRTFVLVPIALALIALTISAVSIFHRSAPTAAATASPKSIAVLPFENRSEEKANAYLADGIQDEILTHLAKVADLKVISRTSTQHYKSTPENVPEIARQLGVAHVLEGSVQKVGDKVRINVQLIQASTDSHIWAETFDRKLIDIFSVETDVARTVADQLGARLSGREQQVLADKPTDNPDAHDAYLRGLAYSLKAATTPATTLGAQRSLREAVRLDPKFALAWALLSYVDSVGYLSLKLQPTLELREEARQAAEMAITLKPNLGEALLAKGYYHYACLKEYDAAIRYFETARQFLPNSSRIPESLGYVARRRGEWDRSESYFDAAERLDPRNINLLTQHALSDVERRHFPEAIVKLDKVLVITPDDVDTIAQKAAVIQAQGDLLRSAALLAPLRPGPEASAALETQVYQAVLERQPGQMIVRLKEVLENPDPALGYINGELRCWLGWAQEVAGDRVKAMANWRQARDELERFLKDQPDNYTLLGDLAWAEVSLGHQSVAMSLAERGMASMTVAQDAIDGGMPIEFLARVAAHAHETDRAVAALQQLLSIPYDGALASGVPLTPALLRLDPMFDSLRDNPQFQKLAGPELKR